MSTLNIGGGTLAFDGSGNWTNAPPGSIVQIQTNTVLSSNVTTSTSFIPSSIQVTITPKFASSKILVTFSAWVRTNAAGNHVTWSLYRNGSNLETTGAIFGMGNYFIDVPSTGLEGQSNVNFIDSPNSTSALTYNVYIKSYNGGTVSLGNPSRASYIHAFEISQ